MCYAASCNPTCGQCRPKRILQAQCPQCGALCEMTREEYLNIYNLPHRKSILEKKLLEGGKITPPRCKECGCDLIEVMKPLVEPAPCRANRVICGYPCGRRDEPYREGAKPCPTMVPLKKLPSEPTL